MDSPRLDDLIRLVQDRASGDELDQLREAASLKSELDEVTDSLLGHFVEQARNTGASWSQIGEALGVSKQAAQQRHATTESSARRILSGLAPKMESGTFRRFTLRAQSAVVAAQEAARNFNHEIIGTEHVLLGLYAEPEGIAAKVLGELGADSAAITTWILEHRSPGERPPSGHIPFEPDAKEALHFALRSAMDLGHNYIGTEHILLGLLRLPASVAGQALAHQGVTHDEARNAVIRRLSGL